MKTKLTFIIITIATLFVTCGSPETDPLFAEAVSDVLAEFNLRGFNPLRITPIVFADLEVGKQETCKKSPLGNVIEVDRAIWERNNRDHHKYLIAHGLGHCMFGRSHDDSLIQFQGQTIPKTIMHSNIDIPFSQRSFANSYYFDELLGIN